jgi:hypothetical protein
VFIGYACQPIGGALLWGSIVSDTSIIDYSNVTFFLSDLLGARGYLGISRGTVWSLIVSFLSAVPCKVTRLSAKEAGEDFPLSIPLDGSPWVSSFPTSSDSLFVPISSWKEIFCFRYARPCPSWGGIHCIWVPRRVSPLAVKRPPGSSGCWFLCFKTISSVSHVDVDSLLVDRC